MKISFSTLGCPGYSWADIYSLAKDFGFHGIEMRGMGEDIFAVKSPFAPENLEKTVAQLKKLRLEICCLSSGCALRFAEKHNETIEELKKYIALAKALGTPYIRVLGDLTAAPVTDFDDECVIEPMKLLAPIAQEAGVTLLIETNGVYSDTKRLADVLSRIASDNVAALWDFNHPYRFNGELPETTITNLGAYIKHVHIKDSIEENGEVVYKLVGEGDLPPMADYMKALRSLNYEGYISLEWLKQYAPELSDAGIVFPHFAHFMEQYLGNAQSAGRLIPNNLGTGYYVWPKNQLIDMTFPQVLDRMCEEFPNQYAFRYTECDYTRTYTEFRDDVDTFARALISMGVKQGDHVSIWATNVPAWYITFWATVKIGAVLVTVNTAYKKHEVEYLLRQSDTHTLVMVDGYKDSNYVEIINALVPELAEHESGTPIHSRKLPFLRNIITVESKQPGCMTWDDALAMAEKTGIDAVYRRAAMLNKHDVCNMQYTSGTTGFPKGVMLITMLSTTARQSVTAWTFPLPTA